MLMRITKARAVKENIVRANVEALHVNENGAVEVVGEYEVAVDIEPFVDVDMNNNNQIEVKFNSESFQLEVQTVAQHLHFTALVANELQGMDWKVSDDFFDVVKDEERQNVSE